MIMPRTLVDCVFMILIGILVISLVAWPIVYLNTEVVVTVTPEPTVEDVRLCAPARYKSDCFETLGYEYKVERK